MATRDELKDPDFLPYEGENRWLASDGRERRLQRYNGIDGWTDVPVLHEAEIPTGGHTPNARNA